MNKGGYWLKETTVYHTLIVDIGFHSHIRYLIRNHSAFQISKATIEKTYAKYNERMGFEGRAREELMITALTNGWIRVRHHLSPYDHWIIQCDGLRERKVIIERFINWGLESHIISDYQTVLILDLSGEREEYSPFKDILEDISQNHLKIQFTVKSFINEINPNDFCNRV